MQKPTGIPSILRAAWRFVRSHAVLCISAVAALATMIAVPPDTAYAAYFDWQTLACLFCILALADAMRNVGVFDRCALAIVGHVTSSRAVVCALVGATALLSMVATNDMALIIMLPLAAATLIHARWFDLIPLVFVLQGLAANLCGMIVPFGNPQNLYLYSYFNIELREFLLTMTLPFIVSTVLIAACSYVLPSVTHKGKSDQREAVERTRRKDGVKRTITYIALFLLTICSVFRLIPVIVPLIAVVVLLAILDRKALAHMDYALLLTFCCFFIFSGNVARIPAVETLLSSAMNNWALLISAGLSQIISNVPAAVLLSHFTLDWQPLLVGVNIGGAGTLVGSLASLIVLQNYLSIKRILMQKEGVSLSTGTFMKYFTVLNTAFLIILIFTNLIG